MIAAPVRSRVAGALFALLSCGSEAQVSGGNSGDLPPCPAGFTPHGYVCASSVTPPPNSNQATTPATTSNQATTPPPPPNQAQQPGPQPSLPTCPGGFTPHGYECVTQRDEADQGDESATGDADGGTSDAEREAAVIAAYAGTLLQGDEKLACEAILCLAAAGATPSECTPSLTRYFSISFRRLSKTLQARADFLRLCPVVSEDSSVAGLVDVLINGAGMCNADNLNTRLSVRSGGGEDADNVVSSTLPAECEAYFSHEYISEERPRYVGTPELGGRWVKAEEYEAAAALWEAQQKAREDAQDEGGFSGAGS